MKSKTTRRALLSSCVALMLCFSMLLGTTYAWFTDSVTSANNVITAGNLDVVLEYKTDWTDDWAEVKEDTKIFDENALYEPGYTETVFLRVSNAGTLALKYDLSVAINDETAGTNVAKDSFKLSDYLEIGAYVQDEYNGDANYADILMPTMFDTREKAVNNVKQSGTGFTKLSQTTTITSSDSPVLPGEKTAKVFALVLTMPTTVGNEANYLTDAADPTKNQPEIKLGVTLLATQLEYESDSFGTDYDKDATYGIRVTTDEELKAAIENPAETYIIVDGALTYDWGGDSYENSKALLMKGKTFSGYDADASITFAGYGSANPIVNATFKNITIKDTTVGDDEKAWEHGYLEFEGLNAMNVTFADSIMLAGDSTLTNCSVPNKIASWYGAWVNGGNVTFKNCTFTGTRAIKIHEANGTEVESVVVDNCTFELSEKPGVAIGTVNAATSVTIQNSSFDTQPGDQGKYIYESDTDVETFDFTEENNKVTVPVETADALVNAFANGNNVKLEKDIELDERLNVGEGKEVYLDMNGKTITVESGSSADPAFYTYKDSTLVIDGNGTVILEDPSMSLLFPGGDVVIENGNFIRNVPAGTPANQVGALIVGAKVSPWGSQTVTINGGYFDGGYYDANAADVDEILAGTKTLTETEADKANRGKSTDKNAVRVAIKNNTQLTLNLSYNLFKIYGGTFVGVNPAWGDEGCMLPATDDIYLRPWSYYQGALLDGQTFNENGIVLPAGYEITKGATADGRPTYTVNYSK